jgi:hypothetical protein
MKILVIITCAALLLPGSAAADLLDLPQTAKERCNPIEYAELKDMPEDALGKVYCETERLAVRRAEQADFAGKMANIDPRGGAFARRDAFERYAAQCKEQAKRVGDIYARLFGKTATCTQNPAA